MLAAVAVMLDTRGSSNKIYYSNKNSCSNYHLLGNIEVW